MPKAKPRLYRYCLLPLILLMTGIANAATPQVATSLKPLELLVRAVGDGQVNVTTLVPAGASPHTYQLRPSQRRDLEAARLVFWVGPGMENFLNRLLDGPDFRDRSIALGAAAGLRGDDHGNETEHRDEEHHGDEHHDHDEDHHHDEPHSHDDDDDPHVWLDPQLALAMAKDIARHLKTLDGVESSQIDRNLAAFTLALTDAEARIREQLRPANNMDLFTYHNAFNRFAEHYGLTITEVLTLSPERTPGARHLAEVQKKLGNAQNPCLLTEPQFNRQWWASLMEGVTVSVSTWDPLAGAIAATPEGYVEFQQSLADAVLRCLPKQAQ